MSMPRLSPVVLFIFCLIVPPAGATSDNLRIRLFSKDPIKPTSRWLASASSGGVWAIYRDPTSGIRVNGGGTDSEILQLQGTGAPSGLAITAEGDDAFVGIRAKQPAKTLLLASTRDLGNPVPIGGDTNPLARLKIHADGASVRALWYGEKQHADSPTQYHLYYRESGNRGSSWSPVEKLLRGIYPIWINDPAGDVAVFSWVAAGDGHQIRARIRTAGADGFAPEIELANVAPITPIFEAFVSGSRWFVYWVAQYGPQRKDFLLEGVWSADKGKNWKHFSFPDLKGLDINTLFPATDGSNIALGVSGSYRFQNPKAKNDVFLLRSFDNGDTWETPLRPRPENVTYSHAWYLQPAFGKAGELFLVWDDWRDIRRSMRFSHSADAGRTWLVSDARIPLDRRRGWGVNPYSRAAYFRDDRIVIASERFTADDMRNKELLWVEMAATGLSEIARRDAAATPAPDTEKLKARVEAFWKAMREEDYETAYGLYDPFFRARIPYHGFRRTLGRVRYISTEVKTLKAQEAVAEVTTHIAAEVPEYRVQSGARVKSSRRDVDVTWRWLLVDGQWYREFSSEVIDKRFAAY